MSAGSTVTNFVCIKQFFSDSFDSNAQPDVIYTHFSKAK